MTTSPRPVSRALRQVVIVASGLDSRAYRLPWPAGTTVYEIDQPEVIAFKTATLAEIGAAPTAELRTVGIDLREDWPAALQASGFDTAKPTAWLAEGVLIGFLPPEAEVRLLNAIIPLSSEGSRFAADFGAVAGTSPKTQEQSRLMAEGWRRQGLDLDITALTYPGEHTDVAAHLQDNGWETTKFRARRAVFRGGPAGTRGSRAPGPRRHDQLRAGDQVLTARVQLAVPRLDKCVDSCTFAAKVTTSVWPATRPASPEGP